MTKPLSANVPRETLEKLKRYEALLKHWQKTINLVSPTTLADAWVRHFEDSLQLLPYMNEGDKKVIDMGSGAGFPALVLATARPETHFTLIESDARKCAFLTNVVAELGLTNAKIINKRIDQVELAADCLTARALAPLTDLLTWGQHFNAHHALFPKGRNWVQEVEIAQKNHTCSTWNIHPSTTEHDARIIEIVIDRA